MISGRLSGVSVVTLSIFAMAIAFSCSSPLSETEFDDPSLIAPYLVISKSIENGTRTVEYICEIYDKNLSLVTLKNGHVRIGGVFLGTRSYLFGGEGYYLQGESQLAHRLNTPYTFTVTFGNGNQYTATVKTQTNDLTDFSAPTHHNRFQDMPISWKRTEPGAVMYVIINYTFATDTSSGFGSKRVEIVNTSNNTTTIKASEFVTDQGKMVEADLTLVSETVGTIDSRFRRGSKIISMLQVTRSVTFI